MWDKGQYNGYSFAVKHFDNPSIYGINGGRISKLEIRRGNEVVYAYDRGECIPAANDEVLNVLDYICTIYN